MSSTRLKPAPITTPLTTSTTFIIHKGRDRSTPPPRGNLMDELLHTCEDPHAARLRRVHRSPHSDELGRHYDQERPTGATTK